MVEIERADIRPVDYETRNGEVILDIEAWRTLQKNLLSLDKEIALLRIELYGGE